MQWETAAATSLQSCPTLCDPIDGSPPGSPVLGILQARTLEWDAIAFSDSGRLLGNKKPRPTNAWKDGWTSKAKEARHKNTVIHLYETSRKGKTMKTWSRSAFSWGWGWEGGDWNGPRQNFQGHENVLKLDCGGTSLVVQGLRLCSQSWSIPGQGTRSHKLQLGVSACHN